MKEAYFSRLTEGALFQEGCSCSGLITWPFLKAKPRRQYMDTAFWDTSGEKRRCKVLDEVRVLLYLTDISFSAVKAH